MLIPLRSLLPTPLQLRLLYILPAIHRTRPPPRQRGNPTHILIVLGSGGHTAEMLSYLTSLSPTTYQQRTYITSSGDDFSALKATEFEDELAAKATGSAKRFVDDARKRAIGEADLNGCCVRSGIRRQGYDIYTIPRARKIHQSLLTTPISSWHCLHACLSLLQSLHVPDLLLSNGPATALIMIIAATILRFFSFLPVYSRFGAAGKMRIIYVESWARVKRPSLSGRIIVWCGLCDRVLVQWKGLETRGWGEYRGVLVR
jgi:beta-1,4-N-acetylglucosaminyltransferase